MKCENCFEEWSVPDIRERVIKFCPFCGTEIKEKEPDGFSNLVDCFKYLKRKYTYTIFFNPQKVLSMVSDYMPEIVVEKRILKVALEAGIYKQLIDDDGLIVSLNVDKAKHTLASEYGLSEIWAGEAVNWLVDSFKTNSMSGNDISQKNKKTERTISPKVETDKPIVKEQHRDNKTFGSDYRGKYVYVGETNDCGIPNGKGELKYDSGDVFIGIFLNGRLNGKGTWIMSSGKTFEGLFEKGKPVECDGVLTEKNGYTYEGHFRRGMRMHGIIRVINHKTNQTTECKYDNGNYVDYYERHYY